MLNKQCEEGSCPDGTECMSLEKDGKFSCECADGRQCSGNTRGLFLSLVPLPSPPRLSFSSLPLPYPPLSVFSTPRPFFTSLNNNCDDVN